MDCLFQAYVEKITRANTLIAAVNLQTIYDLVKSTSSGRSPSSHNFVMTAQAENMNLRCDECQAKKMEQVQNILQTFTQFVSRDNNQPEFKYDTAPNEEAIELTKEFIQKTSDPDVLADLAIAVNLKERPQICERLLLSQENNSSRRCARLMA